MKLAIIAIFTMGLAVSCGSSSASASYQTSDNIKERFSFLKDAFVSTRNSTQACIQAGTADSYTIRTTFEPQTSLTGTETNEVLMTVITEAYRESGCAGTPANTIRQEYVLVIGNEINKGTNLEIDVLVTKFDFTFEDIRNFSEIVLFGKNITVGQYYYTVAVGQGGLQTDPLKYGFANADQAHNGETAAFRANDVSKYTSGNTFLLQK